MSKTVSSINGYSTSTPTQQATTLADSLIIPATLCLNHFVGSDGLRHQCDKSLDDNRQHRERGPHYCEKHGIGEA